MQGSSFFNSVPIVDKSFIESDRASEQWLSILSTLKAAQAEDLLQQPLHIQGTYSLISSQWSMHVNLHFEKDVKLQENSSDDLGDCTHRTQMVQAVETQPTGLEGERDAEEQQKIIEVLHKNSLLVDVDVLMDIVVTLKMKRAADLVEFKRQYDQIVKPISRHINKFLNKPLVFQENWTPEQVKCIERVMEGFTNVLETHGLSIFCHPRDCTKSGVTDLELQADQRHFNCLIAALYDRKDDLSELKFKLFPEVITDEVLLSSYYSTMQRQQYQDQLDVDPKKMTFQKKVEIINLSDKKLFDQVGGEVAKKKRPPQHVPVPVTTQIVSQEERKGEQVSSPSSKGSRDGSSNAGKRPTQISESNQLFGDRHKFSNLDRPTLLGVIKQSNYKESKEFITRLGERNSFYEEYENRTGELNPKQVLTILEDIRFKTRREPYKPLCWFPKKEDDDSTRGGNSQRGGRKTQYRGDGRSSRGGF